MLVLTRIPGDAILITTPDNSVVEIQVIDVIGNRVRLGITADRSTRVDRAEVAAARASNLDYVKRGAM